MRSTTRAGGRASPKTASVRWRPRGETTSPWAPSWPRRRASCSAASARAQSMRRRLSGAMSSPRVPSRDGEKAAPGERPRLNYTDGGGRLQENGRGGQGGGPRRLARCLERQRNKAKPKVEQGTRNVEGRRLLCPSTFDIPCSLFDILFGVLRFRGLRMIPWGLRGRPGS